MSESTVQLIPLLCQQCSTPLRAMPGEVAWVCENCGRGAQLGSGKTLPLDVFFSPEVRPGTKGRPFWVAPGSVDITTRQTYRGNNAQDAETFWQGTRLFFIPAYATSLEDQIATGTALLRQPAAIPQPGGPCPFLPVVVPPEDMRPLAEFIVLAIEADRRDALKTVHFSLNLQPPQLWVLP